MSLKTQINEDLIKSMKAKESFNVKILRGINAAIKQVEVDTKKEVGEEQALTILQKQIKQRKESLGIYKENNRKDLADIEEQELVILEAYLPKQMDEETLTLIIKSTIDSLEATSMKDMGKVMKALKEDTAGKADPSEVSAIVKRQLTSK
jgi:uncharacterized protein YqeY